MICIAEWRYAHQRGLPHEMRLSNLHSCVMGKGLKGEASVAIATHPGAHRANDCAPIPGWFCAIECYLLGSREAVPEVLSLRVAEMAGKLVGGMAATLPSNPGYPSVSGKQTQQLRDGLDNAPPLLLLERVAGINSPSAPQIELDV